MSGRKGVELRLEGPGVALEAGGSALLVLIGALLTERAARETI